MVYTAIHLTVSIAFSHFPNATTFGIS